MRKTIFTLFALLLNGLSSQSVLAYDSDKVRKAIRNSGIVQDFCVHPNNSAHRGACDVNEKGRMQKANVVINPISRYATDCSDTVIVQFGYKSSDGYIYADQGRTRIDSSSLNCKCGRKHCHDGKEWADKSGNLKDVGTVKYFEF